MEFDFQDLSARLETVCTDRIALRTASLADAWPLFEATRNPAFNRHLMWPRPDRPELVLKRMSLIVDAARRGRLAAVSAVERQTGAWMCLYRFMPHAERDGVVEMGIWTHDRYWSRGQSHEIARTCIDAAFAMSGVERLLGAAYRDNAPSRALLERLGLAAQRHVERRTEDGRSVELIEYELDRAGWRAQAAWQPLASFDPYLERLVDPLTEALAVV
jgi:RimJ/RimL family protein N-acetyltransferase